MSTKYLTAEQAIEYIKENEGKLFCIASVSEDDSYQLASNSNSCEHCAPSQRDAQNEFHNIYTQDDDVEINIPRALELVEYIDVNDRGMGWPIRLAAKKGHAVVVKALLDRGANKWLRDALMSCVWNDDIKCALLLLKAGAKVYEPGICGHREWLNFADRYSNELGEYATMKLWK